MSRSVRIDLDRVRRAIASDAARDPLAQAAFDVEPVAGSPPFPQRGAPGGVDPKPAAVLAVVFAAAGEAHLLLTRRADDLPHHAGQISLPGGVPDGADGSLLVTALRETTEELGIAASTLEPLGRLADVYIPPTNFLVTPFVALAAGRPRYRQRPAEVAEVIELPLGALLDPASVGREERALRGLPYLVPFYRFDGVEVWGATARMLATLAHALGAVPAAAPVAATER